MKKAEARGNIVGETYRMSNRYGRRVNAFTYQGNKSARVVSRFSRDSLHRETKKEQADEHRIGIGENQR